MRDGEYFKKKVLPKLLVSLGIAAVPVFLTIQQMNNYDYSPFEASTQSLTKTITIDPNGDAHFVERLERSLDYTFIDQWIYFTSYNDDVQGWSHTPAFDTEVGFANRVKNAAGDVLIEGDGTGTVTDTSRGYTLQLGYGWVPGTVDEFGNTYPPLDDRDDESVRFYHYNQNKWESAIFEYEYTMRGLAVQYDDTAEIAWTIAATDGMSTSNIDISIVLPTTSIEVEDVKAYAIAASQGGAPTIEKNDEGNVVVRYQASHLFPNEYLQAVINFPRSALTIDQDQQNLYHQIIDGVDHLPMVASAIEEQTATRLLYSATDIVALVLFVGLATMAILGTRSIYLNYDKEHTSNFYGQYYRELPKDYGPALMSYLYRFKSVEKEDVSATLMDLIYKKFITVNFEGQLLTDPKANYTLVYDRKKDQTELKEHEKILLRWFFDLVGAGGDTLTLNQLESFNKTELKALQYLDYNKSFVRAVEADGKKQPFFDDVSAASKKGAPLLSVIGVAGAAMIFVSFFLNLGTYTLSLGGFLLAAVVGLSTYFTSIQRRSKEGNEDYLRWRAFFNFLKDFSRMQDYSMPMVTVWEKYMVYAVAFGIADLVEEQLRFKFKQIKQEEALNQSTMFRYPYFYRSYTMGMNRGFMAARQTIAAAQAARNNSGRGGGGRFGGGGGMRFGGGGSGSRLR